MGLEIGLLYMYIHVNSVAADTINIDCVYFTNLVNDICIISDFPFLIKRRVADYE